MASLAPVLAALFVSAMVVVDVFRSSAADGPGAARGPDARA